MLTIWAIVAIIHVCKNVCTHVNVFSLEVALLHGQNKSLSPADCPSV